MTLSSQGDDTSLVNLFIIQLAHRFSLKDLGQLSYFLGVEVVHNKHIVLFSKRKYILDLLAKTKMTQAKPVLTPLLTSPTLGLNTRTPLTDPTEYQTVVDSL